LVATLEASWLTINEDAPLNGYACLAFRRHAVELHDLTDSEGAAYMRGIQRVSSDVQAVTGGDAGRSRGIHAVAFLAYEEIVTA